MIPATPTEITNLLGELDAIVVEQILEIDATVDEVAQALACFEADRAGDARGPMSTRVAAVYSVIDDAFDDPPQEWPDSARA